MNISDLSVLSFLIFLFLLLTIWLSSTLGVRKLLSAGIFFWHTLFSVFYWYYSLSSPADSDHYYDVSLQLRGDLDWTPGTRFVESLTSVFSDMMGLSKLNIFIVYGFLGTIGLLLLASMFFNRWKIPSGWLRYGSYVILFSPNINFWSSAIGKDSPAFLAACLAAFSSMDIRKYKFFFGVSVVLMFLVRPHVAFFMIIALSLSALFGRRVNFSSRVATVAFVISISFVVLPFILEYSGLGDISTVESTTEYVGRRQEANLEGGSSLDIGDMPLPLQMFTYLFRPLFFDASNQMGLIVSFDNLILLAICLGSLKCCIDLFVRQMKNNFSFGVIFNVIYFFLVLVVFSMTTANLGIAVRQKTMIIPSLFAIILIANNSKEVERRLLKTS
jgi:hypothetical protein